MPRRVTYNKVKYDNLTVAEIAWTAGIIDGEGSIYLGSDNVRTRTRVQVGNTDLRMLHQLRDFWGGLIGTATLPQGNRKQLFYWSIYGREIIDAFLVKIQPYLVTKRDQADLMLEYLGCMKETDYKPTSIEGWQTHDYYERAIKAKNHRGVI